MSNKLKTGLVCCAQTLAALSSAADVQLCISIEESYLILKCTWKTTRNRHRWPKSLRAYLLFFCFIIYYNRRSPPFRHFTKFQMKKAPTKQMTKQIGSVHLIIAGVKRALSRNLTILEDRRKSALCTGANVQKERYALGAHIFRIYEDWFTSGCKYIIYICVVTVVTS